jgi:hypothetical protein
MAKRTAAKSIHRSKWMQPHGHPAANSIGGLGNGESGWAGYAARTAVKGGLERLIFVVPGSSERGLSEISTSFRREER